MMTPEHKEQDIMDTPSRSGRITIDLLGYKQAWLDHCKANGTTPSEAFRMVVAKLIHTSVETEFAPSTVDPASRKVRREVRLTESEVSAAEALAAGEGFALSRWIVALIRARLAGGPQLGQQELEALARSNMQMLALGRTLNQLAKAAHAKPDVLRGFQVTQIEQTAALVREHVAFVSGVLKSNTSRWSSA